MKKLSITFLIGLITSTVGYSIGVIVLEGNYQGKNLYVSNPYANSSNVGFCVQEVRVNGNVTTDEITSSAFEIDFKALKLKIGDKVEIKITHKDGCKPKVLNPEVLKPKSTFDVTEMSVDNTMILKWTTKNELGKLPFVLEQYRWNKWVKIDEIQGVGIPGENHYTYKITPHSGKNQFRVKQVDYTGQARVSKSVDYTSSAGEVTFSPSKVSKDISFMANNKPAETMYEIFDQYGNVLKRGTAASVDVSNLPKGSYYIDYDNKMGDFTKK